MSPRKARISKVILMIIVIMIVIIIIIITNPAKVVHPVSIISIFEFSI